MASKNAEVSLDLVPLSLLTRHNSFFKIELESKQALTAGANVVQQPPVPEAPAGTPPGLEYLAHLDQVLIQQQVELVEGLKMHGFDTKL